MNKYKLIQKNKINNYNVQSEMQTKTPIHLYTIIINLVIQLIIFYVLYFKKFQLIVDLKHVLSEVT